MGVALTGCKLNVLNVLDRMNNMVSIGMTVRNIQ